MNRLRALGGGLCSAAALLALAFGSECGRTNAGTSATAGDAAPSSDGQADASSAQGPEAEADVQTLDVYADGSSPDSGTTGNDGSAYIGDGCPPPLDAGVISDWPGFRRIAELDPCCPNDVALDASAAAPPVQWIPCVNGASGCLEMKAGWYLAPFAWTEASVGDDGTPQYLHILRQLSNVEGEDDVYQFAGMAPLAAWRLALGSSSCFTELLLGGASAVLLDFVNTGAPSGTYVASGAPASLAVAPHFVSVGDNLLLRVPQDVHSSETTIGFDIGPSALVVSAPLDGGHTYVAAPVPGQVSVAVVSRNDVFAWSTYGTAGWGQLYVMRPDGSLMLFRSNANAHVSALATDGPNLYWAETYGSMDLGAQQHDSQIWTAPYTDDPAQLAATAREIADVQGTTLPEGAIAFGGLFAFATLPGIYVVRASDGAVAKAPTPGSYRYQQLTYVTGAELWSLMGSQNGASGVAFVRVQLGPWQGGD